MDLKVMGGYRRGFSSGRMGKVVSYQVRSRRPQVVKIKMNGVIEEVQSESFAQLPFSDYFTPRSGLKRFYTAVNEHKKATVGFLGGSITFNPGWREKVTPI